MVNKILKYNLPDGAELATAIVDKRTYTKVKVVLGAYGEVITPTPYKDTSLLEEILGELRIMNYHLALISEGDQ